MQGLEAQHANGVETVPQLGPGVRHISCDSRLLHNAQSAVKNSSRCDKPAPPLMHGSCDLWGPVSIPSPHGLRYCIFVIDYHTHFMWVRFMKTKDESCALLESILLEIKHLHAKHHAHTSALAHVL
jgi:hypothetical protein